MLFISFGRLERFGQNALYIRSTSGHYHHSGTGISPPHLIPPPLIAPLPRQVRSLVELAATALPQCPEQPLSKFLYSRGRGGAEPAATATPPRGLWLRHLSKPLHPMGRGNAGLAATAVPLDCYSLLHMRKFFRSMGRGVAGLEATAVPLDCHSVRQMRKSLRPKGRGDAGLASTAIPTNGLWLRHPCTYERS
jgi:hypothetical protein